MIISTERQLDHWNVELTKYRIEDDEVGKQIQHNLDKAFSSLTLSIALGARHSREEQIIDNSEVWNQDHH